VRNLWTGSCIMLKPSFQLDSLCWFSHLCSRTGENCCRQNHSQAAVNVHCRHPRRPHNGLVCCCVQCTTTARASPYHALSLGMTRHFFIFVPGGPWPLTLTFELGRDFCTVHLAAKFHRPTFNRSEVIMQTNKQTGAAENIHLYRPTVFCRHVTGMGHCTNSKTLISSDL